MFPLPVDFNFEPGKYIVKIAAGRAHVLAIDNVGDVNLGLQ